MYKKKRSKNGLSVVVSPMPQMASVSLGIWIGVGGRYEKSSQSGISHVVEHMLFKGTHQRSTKDLKESIEGIGGSFNGFTSDEVTCYMVKVPSKYMELGMDILSDMVLNAKFDAEDLVRERFVICEEIKMYRDQPADHVLEMLGKIMWPDNALGRPLTGTIGNVKGFKNPEIIKFKEDHYHPANIAIVASGKVDPVKLFRNVSKKFAGQKRKKKKEFKKPVVSQKKPASTFVRGDTKQTHIAMGFHAVDHNIRERFALKIMNVILGGNMSSRLFEELREKYGLCYDISSLYKRHSDVGDLVIHSGVDNRNAQKAIIAILDELKKLKDLGVTRDELNRAKEYAKGQFLLAMEGTSSRMMWLGDRLMTMKHIPEVKVVLKNIDDVTVNDIKKVCEKVFVPEVINLAIIGDLKSGVKNKIRKELCRI